MTTRRQFIKNGSVAAAALAAPMINVGRFRVFADPRIEYSERAVRLVRETTVVDMLNAFEDYRRTPGGEDLSTFWLRRPSGFTEKDLRPFRETGISVFSLGWNGDGSYEHSLDWMSHFNGFIATHDDWFMRVDEAEDLRRVKASGKLGILLSAQNSNHFRKLDDVDYFYGLGQRVSQLTYNKRNMIGNGAFERRDEGLSDYGLQVVERMNKVGMAIDVSHCGDRTTLDAIESSKGPVLITHATCRALIPNHPRAKTDEAIRKLAAKGGVMGIAFVRFMVRSQEPTTVEHLLDHFDYAVKLVGPEHVGVGTDYPLYGVDAVDPARRDRERAGMDPRYGAAGRRDQLDGIDDIKRIYDLTEGLIRRKYSDASIRLILGDNFRRVLSELWV
ncbi:MAG: dipeptidase [Acidobacteriota bacterium]|nr:dipeptidase [Acidobacteriota bacterium]